MVIITYKMKQAMDHHTVKLLVKISTIFNGILTNRVDTYEQVTGKLFSFTVIKGYDVGEIIMAEVPHVYIQDVVIRTEDNVDITYSLYFASGNHLQPTVVGEFIL